MCKIVSSLRNKKVKYVLPVMDVFKGEKLVAHPHTEVLVELLAEELKELEFGHQRTGFAHVNRFWLVSAHSAAILAAVVAVPVRDLEEPVGTPVPPRRLEPSQLELVQRELEMEIKLC